MSEHPYHTEKLRSVIDLDTYRNDIFTLGNFALTEVLDNILVIEFLDTSDGTDIKHGGIILPAAHVRCAWRLGRVVLAGPNCEQVGEGDFVCFPNDKGIPVSNISVRTRGMEGSPVITRKLKMATFLDETRIFGKIEPYDPNLDQEEKVLEISEELEEDQSPAGTCAVPPSDGWPTVAEPPALVSPVVAETFYNEGGALTTFGQTLKKVT